jgi:hypothetical protein
MDLYRSKAKQEIEVSGVKVFHIEAPLYPAKKPVDNVNRLSEAPLYPAKK